VVNYGSHGLIDRNLGRLDLAGISALPVVVDNYRSEPARRAISQLCAERGWLLRSMSANLGFGAAVNAGVAEAIAQGCDRVAILNPDLAVSTDVLTELADAVRAEPTLVVSPRIVRPDGRTWFEGAFVSLDEARTQWTPGPTGPRTPPWLSGACLVVHRDLWRTVGGFDDAYFMYWEDVDLSVRLAAAGGQLMVRNDLTAVHDVGATQHRTDQRAKSPLYYYYNCRNRLLFAAKHLGPRDRRRWLVRTPGEIRQVVLRGGRRQLLRPQRCLWPALRGAAAGTWILMHSTLRARSR
jgi:GT2 family glycosyltransferase